MLLQTAEEQCLVKELNTVIKEGKSFNQESANCLCFTQTNPCNIRLHNGTAFILQNIFAREILCRHDSYKSKEGSYSFPPQTFALYNLNCNH
jgi:hypothetical protein